MKGIILAGGFGTRMRPATKITNKHMLPVYSDQGAIPMLFYPINTLVSSGIEDILIVSSKEHAGHIIQNLSDGHDFSANFSYKIQDTSRVSLGIASALGLAKDFTKDDCFAVILGVFNYI
jgi:glucose-1-phosphate thymidylyltransferase